MIEKLRELGLSDYETRVYLCLVENGALKGGEVARISKVPQGKVYLVLQGLIEKSFVNVLEIKPKIFQPVDPEIAIRHAVAKKVDELSGLKNDLVNGLKAWKKPSAKESISEKIQVLPGNKSMQALNEHFFHNAKKEIRLMFTYEYRPSFFVRELHAAVKKGLKVKLICSMMTKQGLKWVKEDIKAGVDVRYYPVDEIRLQIMDDSEARIGVLNPKDKRDRVMIYFQHGELAKFLKEYFDSLWKKGKKINSDSKFGDYSL
jgi:sugar-specific transcriptional regulator TrmB